MDTQIARYSTDLLPLGIHFGLNEDAYHADPGIGSTDIRRLARDPVSYWYQSWMNAEGRDDFDIDDEDKSTPSQAKGTALHVLLFYGRERFDKTYMCGPRQKGMTSGEKSASTQKANAKAAETGRIALKFKDFCWIGVADALIRRNPDLAECFRHGESEVSFIFEKDGIRRKVRWDYLKVLGNGDLKSCANKFKKSFDIACRDDITNYQYHEQATYYMDARLELPAYVREGAVYGSHDPDWLRHVANQKVFGWQWVFYQMTGAPITWSKYLSPGSGILDCGRMANEIGLRNYRKYMATFGTEMWVQIEKPTELHIEEMPPWFGREFAT